MNIDFEKLYEPYNGKATLDETLAWLIKTASQAGVDRALIDKAVNETFLEMAAGKEFPTDGGDTGFDGFPHAVLNHYMLKKAVELNSICTVAYAKATEGRVQARLDLLVKKHLTEIDNSWFVRFFRWFKSKGK
jgi:hypothetical protein